MSGFSTGILNGNGTTPVAYTGSNHNSILNPLSGTFYIEQSGSSISLYSYNGSSWLESSGGSGGGVTSIGGKSGAITLDTSLSVSAGNVLSANVSRAIWNASSLVGIGISNTAPTLNQALVYNGTSWTPENVVNSWGGISGTITTGLGIVVIGNNVTIAANTALWNANELQGRAIATAVPTTNQVLQWNGTSWAPGTVTGTGVTSIGGVSGAITLATGLVMSGAQLVVQTGSAIWNANELQSKSVSVVAPTGGQVLAYNSTTTEWEPTTISSPANAFVNGGNSFGTSANLGTLDNNSLSFQTNGSVRATFLSGGELLIGASSGLGGITTIWGNITQPVLSVTNIGAAEAATFVAPGTDYGWVVSVQGTNVGGYSGIGFYDHNTVHKGFFGYANSGTAFSPNTFLNFVYDTTTDWAWSVNGTESMRLGNAGNLQINGATISGKPMVLVSPAGGGSPSWNSNGVSYAVNQSTLYTGDILDYRIGGVTVLSLDYTGLMLLGSGVVAIAPDDIFVAGAPGSVVTINTSGGLLANGEIFGDGGVRVQGVTGSTFSLNNSAVGPTYAAGTIPSEYYGTKTATLCTPTGWILINVGGTDYSVPYY